MEIFKNEETQDLKQGVSIGDTFLYAKDIFKTVISNKYIAYPGLEKFKCECYEYLMQMKPNSITSYALDVYRSTNKSEVMLDFENGLERLVDNRIATIKEDKYVTVSEDRCVRIVLVEPVNRQTLVLNMIHAFNKDKRDKEAIPALNRLTNKVVPKGYTKIKNAKTKDIAMHAIQVAELEYSEKLTSDLAMSFSSYILNLRDLSKTTILGELKSLSDSETLLLFKLFEGFLRFNRTLTRELILEEFVNKFNSKEYSFNDIELDLIYLTHLSNREPLYVKLKDYANNSLFGESIEPEEKFYTTIVNGNPNSKRIILVNALESNKYVEHMLGDLILTEIGEDILIKSYKEKCLPEYQCIKYPEEYYHSGDISYLIETLTGKLD